MNTCLMLKYLMKNIECNYRLSKASEILSGVDNGKSGIGMVCMPLKHAHSLLCNS